jgi:DNA repair protein RadC
MKSEVNWILHINNDDVVVTRAIADAGKLLDIDLIDHLIIGHGEKWVSLKQRGLGFS